MISHAVNGSIKIGKRTAVLAVLLLLLSSCQPVCTDIEPEIPYFPQARQLQYKPSPFAELTKEELREEWAKELHIGLVFGHEMDLYRAITAFKRALILLPPKRTERRSQIEYCIFQSYYLGHKYPEAVELFENSSLLTVPHSFPAYKEMGIMLYECYIQKGQEDKAERILELLKEEDPQIAERLELWSSFLEMNFDSIAAHAPCQPDGEALTSFISCYEGEAKSIRKARLLNGLMPGLGYLYVGQKQTAATSFIINALFTGAAYFFFKNDNIPMGIITASLESGWYLGGINGAGLAARDYNKRLYEENGKEMMLQQRLIPFLMLETTF